MRLNTTQSSSPRLIDQISFAHIFENAIEPQFFLDIQGRFVEVNQAACLYLGVTSSEITQKSIYEVTDSENVYIQGLLRNVSEIGSTVAEVEFVSETSTKLIANMFFQVVDKDKETYLFCRLHDLSSILHLHNKLEEVERFYAGAERLAHLGSWAFDPVKNSIIWSQEIYHIFGLPVNSAPPNLEEYISLIYPEDVPTFTEVVQNAIENGVNYSIKHRIVRSDGAIRWVYGIGDIGVDAHGNFEKLFGTVQDITEEEEIREEVRKSQQLLQIHIKNSPLGYIEWDDELKVIEWNPAAERIFGFSKEEALHEMPEIIPSEQEARINEVFTSLLEGTGGTYSINHNIRKNGEEIICEWHNTRLLDEKGTLIGVGSFVQDITLKQRAKKQLKDYAMQLKSAKEKAESAARAKSHFLANMSHEIRTPMNGVIGMASLLLGTDLDEEQRDFVETMVNSGESLLEIINDILDFSKIEANKIELEHRPFTISTTIENTLDLLAAKSAEKGLELLHHYSFDDIDHAIGDPTRFQQVLLNLLSNAIKFTKRGYVEVYSSVNEVEDGRVLLTVDVVDSGIGIPEDKMDRLFKAFSQVDASTTRKYGGTGLGLSISAKLCHLMGGSINVRNNEGDGSTFTFTVQLDQGYEGQQERPVFRDPPRVLLGEPDEKVLRSISRLLSHMRVDVTTVASGIEAVDVLTHAEGYDVALLAYQFSDINALEVVSRLHESLPCVPAVVLLSRITDRIDSPLIDGRIAKPAHYHSLYNIIKKLTVLQD